MARRFNQIERLDKIKKGPGTFVYLGNGYDTESVPGVPLIGKDGHQMRAVKTVTMKDSDGGDVQVLDPKTDGRGALIWKKPPQFFRHKMETYRIRIPGIDGEWDEEAKAYVPKVGPDGKPVQMFLEFPSGKPVYVGDLSVAVKLRCSRCFKEVAGDAEVTAAVKAHEDAAKSAKKSA